MQCGILDGTLEDKKDINGEAAANLYMKHKVYQ